MDYFLDDDPQQQKEHPKGDTAVEAETIGARLSSLFSNINSNHILIGLAVVAGYLIFVKKR